MTTSRWAYYADKILAELFRVGEPAPTREQVRDAYPFGVRKHWPYKVWVGRVKAFRAAHAKGMTQPARLSTVQQHRKNVERADRATGDLFG